MPKTNDAAGATYAGHTGIVEHAGGYASTRPGGLSELDPEKSIDGTLIEGDHPDHPDADKGEDELKREGAVADPTGVRPIEPAPAEDNDHAPDSAKRGEEEGNVAEEEKGEQSSPGSSSQTPSASTQSSKPKSARSSR